MNHLNAIARSADLADAERGKSYTEATGITRREFALESVGMIAAGVWSLATGTKAVAASPPNDQLILRFLVAADLHWGGYDDWRPERKEATIAAINKACASRPTQFIVLNGDIIHNDPVNQIPNFKPDLRRLTAPVYMTHGNHDLMSDEQFLNFIGHPKNHHFTIRVHPRRYYAFILLNTYSSPSDIGAGNHSGGHICPDIKFLNGTLEKYKDADHTFIFAHRCPTDNVNCAVWLDLMKSTRNVSGFYGHAHTRWDSRDIQGHINHFSGHNTDESNRRGWQSWHSYRVVELTHRTIKTHVYDYTNEIIRSSHTIKDFVEPLHNQRVCP